MQYPGTGRTGPAVVCHRVPVVRPPKYRRQGVAKGWRGVEPVRRGAGGAVGWWWCVAVQVQGEGAGYKARQGVCGGQIAGVGNRIPAQPRMRGEPWCARVCGACGVRKRPTGLR